MNFLKRISLPLFGLMLLFSACQKDTEIDTTGVETPEVITETIEVNPLVAQSSNSGGDGLDLDCFSVLYPFDMADEDGNTYTIDSDASFETLLTDEVFLADFVYPLNIEDEDGNISVIEDGEGLAEAFALCVPGGGWEDGSFPAYLIDSENSCFDLAYPISLIDYDGNSIEVVDENELNSAVADGIYFFQFPLSLFAEDGEVIIVDDIDALFEALISCNGFEIEDSAFVWETGFEYLGCYMIEFPLEIVLLDGTTVTVENHMEYCDLMLQGEIDNFAFPLTLTGEDGEEVTVANEVELEELLSECWGTFFFGNGYLDLSVLYTGTQELNPTTMEPCYEIVFPLYLDYDGEVEQLDDAADIEEILNELDPEIYDFELQYPVELTLADSTTVSINNIEECVALLTECQ